MPPQCKNMIARRRIDHQCIYWLGSCAGCGRIIYFSLSPPPPPRSAGAEHELWGSPKGARFFVGNASIEGMCWASPSINRFVGHFSPACTENRFHSTWQYRACWFCLNILVFIIHKAEPSSLKLSSIIGSCVSSLSGRSDFPSSYRP